MARRPQAVRQPNENVPAFLHLNEDTPLRRPVRLHRFKQPVETPYGKLTVTGSAGGEGPAFVILPGYTAVDSIYGDVAGVIAGCFDLTVVSVNNVGHGGSSHLPRNHNRIQAMAEVIYLALKQLGIRRCVMAGHSLGGQIAAYIAANHPEFLIELILVNSITGEYWDKRIDEIRPVARRFAEGNPFQRVTAAPVLLPKIAPLIGNLVVDSARMVRSSRRADESTVARVGLSVYLNHLLRPQDLLPAGLAILTGDPTVPVLDEIEVPTLVMHGGSDPVVTVADALSTHEHIKHSRLTFVDPSGADEQTLATIMGHSWWLEQSAAFRDIAFESLQKGPFGKLLRSEIKSFGFDSRTVTIEEILTSGTFFDPGARILELLQPVEHFDPPNGRRRHARATWRHHEEV